MDSENQHFTVDDWKKVIFYQWIHVWLFCLLWSWTPAQNWLTLIKMKYHYTSTTPSGLHLCGDWFILLPDNEHKHTSKLFNNCVKNQRPRNPNSHGHFSAVTWPQPHWTFMETDEDWAGQAFLDSTRSFYGTLSDNAGITQVIRISTNVWSPCQKGTCQILRYSEIHRHFSKIQLFTQMIKPVLSSVMKKRYSRYALFWLVFSDFWTLLYINYRFLLSTLIQSLNTKFKYYKNKMLKRWNLFSFELRAQICYYG